MDKRRIGFYYNYSDSWIGGKYYLDNIINNLKKKEENEIVFLNTYRRSFIVRVLGKFFGKESNLYKSIINKQLNSYNLDVIFQYHENSYFANKKISWIPDFQENYYPEFFTIDEICARLNLQAKIAYSDNCLVLSSESAKNDFERLYPKHTCSIFVLKFISSLVDMEIKINDTITKKYDIREPFFICSNQFWVHKNHIIVIKALKALKDNGYHVLCVFTGKEVDYRNPEYINKIKKLVIDYGLEKEVKFLGFIPREDQIELMRKSIAILQPSLFEGWNTTIEDAKFLGKLIIASSLPVHKEQLRDKGYYFDVDDYITLAKTMQNVYSLPMCNVKYNYEEQIESYKINIYKLFE